MKKEILIKKLTIIKVMFYMIIIALSVGSWLFFYSRGLILIYNDAMSHLNITRSIIDNMQPGFSQLGGVWLPLNHVLPLIFIWNDWAWHSGFAGSIFSMVAYCISVVAIYHIVKMLTNKVSLSLVGAATFALNLNMLYLQATPLTESIYLLCFILSALFFIKYILIEKIEYLLLLGLFTFLQILVRYDGWFVGFFTLLLLFYHEYFTNKESLKTTIGKLVMVSFPIFFGIILWLGWELLIFNNPLYFAIGPYSAHAQQSVIQAKSGLITNHNMYLSIVVYTLAMIDNIGKYIFVLSLEGLILFLLFKHKILHLNKKIVICGMLLSPIIFNILSLYMGFSILNVPEFHWNLSSDSSGQWFNVRYAVLALPAAAVFFSLLFSWNKILSIFAIAVLVLQIINLYQYGIITITDGAIGTSSYVNFDISTKLQTLVSPNEQILMSTSYFNPVIFKSGLMMKQVIHEGVHEKWQDALAYPENYVKWIAMASGDVGEPVYTSLVKKQKNRFLSMYTRVFVGKHSVVYRLKTREELFITRDKNTLKVGKEKFYIKGVNSYDLAYKNNQDITNIFENLQKAKINTIRFWMFGDGIADGFQPQAGIINEDKFRKTDYILSLASKYNMRVIPVFLNNWNDYGGKKQYLLWTGKNVENEDVFYKDPVEIKLVENYINKVVTRKNILTNMSYSDDPHIIAWEIMNEPRSQVVNKESVIGWTNNIAMSIKHSDSNHLVTIGTEREVSDENSEQASNLCSVRAIDICSIHLYFFDKNTPLFDSYTQLSQVIKQQAIYAKALNKPIIIGEIGASKSTKPFGDNPLRALTKVINDSTIKLYSGVLVWNYSSTSDTSFGFSQNGNNKKEYSLTDLNSILPNNKK